MGRGRVGNGGMIYSLKDTVRRGREIRREKHNAGSQIVVFRAGDAKSLEKRQWMMTRDLAPRSLPNANESTAA